MGAVGTLLNPLALPMCFWFGQNKIEGVRIVGLIFGCAMILFGIVPSIFCKERTHNQQKISLIEAFKHTFSNKPFLIVCGIILFTVLGVFICTPLQYYVNMAYVAPGNESFVSKLIMYCTYTSSVMGFLCVPVISYLSRRFGKKIVLLGGLSFVMAGTLLSWMLYTPNYPYLQLLVNLLISPGWGCVYLILAAFVADICDMDELATDRRREGMFGAIFNLFLKVGVALTMVVSGYVISWIGYDSAKPLQSAQTVYRIRTILAFVPFAVLAAAMALTWFYPLSKAKVLDICRQLDERQAAGGNLDKSHLQ